MLKNRKNCHGEPVESMILLSKVALRQALGDALANFSKTLLVVFFLSLVGCSQKEDNGDKLTLLGGILLLNSPRQTGDFNCNTFPSPVTFAEFQNLMDTLNTSVSKCSECHGVNTAQSNFIITNYNSVLERVTPNSPNTSTLYFKVRPGGAMNVYSNSQVNQAIYCWISNGAKP